MLEPDMDFSWDGPGNASVQPNLVTCLLIYPCGEGLGSQNVCLLSVRSIFFLIGAYWFNKKI